MADEPPPLLRSPPSALDETLAKAEAAVADRRAELERRARAGEATALAQARLRLAEGDLAILRDLWRALLGPHPGDRGQSGGLAPPRDRPHANGYVSPSRGSRRAGEVPTISLFFGILIRMHYRDHQPPHVHAIYQGHEALVSIETGEILEGRLPRSAARLVQEWAQRRRAELLANWQRARAFEPLELIPGADDD